EISRVSAAEKICSRRMAGAEVRARVLHVSRIKGRPMSEHKANKYYLLFVRHSGSLGLAVFNRCTVHSFSSSVLSCLERERLEEDLSEARILGRNLARLRLLTQRERKRLYEREQQAHARIRDHGVVRVCQS